MAGIPNRRKGERAQSYRLRVLDAELTRRDNKRIKQLEDQMQRLQQAFDEVYESLHREWLRALRAKPGTKYDITAKKKKSSTRQVKSARKHLT